MAEHTLTRREEIKAPLTRTEHDADGTVADLENEILRLCEELQNRDLSIAELEESHAWQMRARCDSEARAIADASVLRQTLAEVYASTSWRVTGPLRAFTMLVRKMRNRHHPVPLSQDSKTIHHDAAGDVQALLEPDPQVLGAWSALLYRQVARSGEGR